MALPDVQQNKGGFHKMPIKKVGVRNMTVPFRVKVKGKHDSFKTIAKISSYCNLVEDLKGINMSRISRTINNVLLDDNIGFSNLTTFAYQILDLYPKIV